MNVRCPQCEKYTLTEVKKGKYSDSTMRKFPRLVSNIAQMYPKQCDRIGKNNKCYNEHRFYCGNCKTECTYDTQLRTVEIVPNDSQFIYDPDQGLLIERV